MIVTTLISIISPVLSIPFMMLSFFKEKEIKKGYAVPLAMIFGAVGYGIYPKSENDLTRYVAMLDGISHQPLLEIMQNDQEFLYTRDVLFFFISRTNDFQLLPFFVAFVVYYISFYITLDMCRRAEFSKLNSGKQSCLLILLFSVSIVSPLSIISNVRNITAFMLIAFAAYRELVEKKRNAFTWILYIIPLGLHISALVIILIRISMVFVKKSKTVLVAAILFPGLVEFARQVMVYIGDSNIVLSMLNRVVNKAYFYLQWDSGGWADVVKNSWSDKITRIYGTIILISFIYIVLRVIPKVNVDVYKMPSFIYFVSAISIGCLYITTGAFWRFEALAILTSGIVLAPAFKDKRLHTQYILNFLLITSWGMFIFNATRFFREIEVFEFIQNVFIFNGFKVIYCLPNALQNILW